MSDSEDLVSKCILRLEVIEPSQDDVSQNSAITSINESKQKSRGQRKVCDISVETFPSRLEPAREDWGLLPEYSRELTLKKPEVEKDEIGFFSGNPFVEITKGILHLYKEDVLSSRQDALTICLLGVPTSMTCHDLLAFTAPCHEEISHIRVLRDSLPNQYMALLT